MTVENGGNFFQVVKAYFDKWFNLEGEMFFLQREVIESVLFRTKKKFLLAKQPRLVKLLGFGDLHLKFGTVVLLTKWLALCNSDIKVILSQFLTST